MQSDADFDTALASYEPVPLGARRTYRYHCPRCLRGISNPQLLERPHWREHGPRICSTCIRWEQTWSTVEEQRRDRDEHLRGIK